MARPAHSGKPPNRPLLCGAWHTRVHKSKTPSVPKRCHDQHGTNLRLSEHGRCRGTTTYDCRLGRVKQKMKCPPKTAIFAHFAPLFFPEAVSIGLLVPVWSHIVPGTKRGIRTYTCSDSNTYRRVPSDKVVPPVDLLRWRCCHLTESLQT